MTRLRLGALVSLVLIAGFPLVVLRPGARRSRIQVGAEAPRPNEDGLVVKVTPLGEAGLRAELAGTWVSHKAPFLLGPRTLGNPLLVYGFAVSVENTSDKDVEILCGDASKPFRAHIQFQDFEGETLPFPDRRATISLKELGPIASDPVVRMKPGEARTLKTLSNLEYVDGIDGFPRPGNYAVQVTCSYYRAPDAKRMEAGAATPYHLMIDLKRMRMASAPVTVTLTDRDIREWRFLRTVQRVLDGDPRVFKEMGRFLGGVLRPLYDAMPSLSLRRWRGGAGRAFSPLVACNEGWLRRSDALRRGLRIMVVKPPMAIVWRA